MLLPVASVPGFLGCSWRLVRGSLDAGAVAPVEGTGSIRRLLASVVLDVLSFGCAGGEGLAGRGRGVGLLRRPGFIGGRSPLLSRLARLPTSSLRCPRRILVLCSVVGVGDLGYRGKPLVAERATMMATPAGARLLLEGTRRGIGPLLTLPLPRVKALSPFGR